MWAPYDASQDDGDGDGDDDGLGPLTQAPLSQPPPMTRGASQWAASQASQLPSPPSPGRRRRAARAGAAALAAADDAGRVAVGRRLRVEGRGPGRDGVGLLAASGDGAAHGGAPMEVEEEEAEYDDGNDVDPLGPLDLKSVDPWEVARQCLPPLPAGVMAPT